VVSPLFSVRVHRFVDGRYSGEGVKCDYVGKGKTLNLFLSKRSYINNLIDKTVKLLINKPEFVDRLLSKIQRIPKIIEILDRYNVDENKFNSYLALVKKNPSILRENIEKVQASSSSSEDEPIYPLQLSTSNPIGCLITVIVFYPIAIVLSLIIATITIITCLNVGGCFENIASSILASLLQDLTPP
ncbi:MAG: hypothetical protein DRN08_01835, partial [Thermoplasmata archaeon]